MINKCILIKDGSCDNEWLFILYDLSVSMCIIIMLNYYGFNTIDVLFLCKSSLQMDNVLHTSVNLHAEILFTLYP